MNAELQNARHGRGYGRAWRTAELRKLRRLYPAHTQRSVARILGRTLQSVRSKALVLGLRRNRNYQTWTAAERRELRRLYPDHFMAGLARRFGRTVLKVYAAAARYGVKKSARFLAEHCRMKRGTRLGIATEFKKGHVPANKGLRRPGWFAGRMRETQFKKGNPSHSWLPVGTIQANADGYLRMKVRDDAQAISGIGASSTNWMFVHKMVWETAHGPIPPGHRLWWKDGNHRNCALENLELLTGQEHMARTTIHNLPPELKQVIQLTGALKRRIVRLAEHGEEYHHRPERPPLRNARGVEGQGSAAGA